jgi:hypothetical protein
MTISKDDTELYIDALKRMQKEILREDWASSNSE